MNPRLLPLLAFVVALPATAAPLPTFTDRLGELPPLSLAEAVKGTIGNSVVGEPGPQVDAVRTAALERKQVSAMPVIPPAAGFRSNMPVLTPDPAVDYKLIVKEPAVEAAK